MDRLDEIRVELRKLRGLLKDFESSPIGLRKEFGFVRGLCVETLMSYERGSEVFALLNNFVAIALEVKSGSLSVEVDFPYIYKEVDKILKLLE